jgi:hypothetical protein
MIKTCSRNCLGLLLAGLITAQAVAYNRHLDSSAVRDAYFLGSDNSQSARFLAGYKKALPVPKSGPNIAEIEVRTPFAQVVENSHEHSIGYSAQQAEQDYQKTPDTFQVRVQILATATFGIGAAINQLPPSACQGVNRMNSVLDCFHDFQFRFSQKEDIHAKESFGVPIYSDSPDGSGVIGGNIWFTFRTSDIATGPLLVIVVTPDGQEVSAEFDLAGLR